MPIGLAVFFLIYPKVKHSEKASFQKKFLILIFVTMMESDLLYSFMSPLAHFGDLYSASQTLSLSPALLSIAALFLSILVYNPILKEYLELLAPFSASPKDSLANSKARFWFLLKVTFVPIIFVIALEFVVLSLFNGIPVGAFYFLGLSIMVSPLSLAALVASRRYKQKNEIKQATALEAQLAFLALEEYAVIFVVLMVVDTAFFGTSPPTSA